MTSETYTDISHRHDFVLLFDVIDGNPNGDPDAGNLPRVDPETMHGLVTDVCLKRKVRNYVDILRGKEERYKIYVQHNSYLYDQQARAYTALGMDKGKSDVEKPRKWMCDNFFDVRMFGAVMSTKAYNCGQVCGPIQLTFARSIDPITPLDIGITRVALTKPSDRKESSIEENEDMAPTHGTMGRKALLPYGLYRGHGFFTPHFAKKTGCTPEDLDLFWEALRKMWDMDRSAARGLISLRGLYIFSHQSGLGNAPAHTLFARITVTRKRDVKTPRKFSDYTVMVEENNMPNGVTLTSLAG
ncbi:MAG: type I-C CRISPR-associated protein Cas7/Csd2 [Dehalococcoidia bacterium]|nr:type I-C CRISPR-associated protein Cas7/Csd2 [Dehalococcoidia bacterium]